MKKFQERLDILILKIKENKDSIKGCESNNKTELVIFLKEQLEIHIKELINLKEELHYELSMLIYEKKRIRQIDIEAERTLYYSSCEIIEKFEKLIFNVDNFLKSIKD